MKTLDSDYSWKAELRFLEKKTRDIVGKSIRVKAVPPESDQLGYTNDIPEIFLAREHSVMETLSEKEKTFFRMGVFAHEILHQIFSDFDILEKNQKKYKLPIEQRLFVIFLNLVEDPCIEYYAPSVIGGKLLKALRFSIQHIWHISAPVDKAKTALAQYMSALIMLGDMGVVKGNFTFPQAAECFVKSAAVFNKGVLSKQPEGRAKAARKLMDISRPLWEEEAEKEELFRQLINSLEESGISDDITMSGGKSAVPDSETKRPDESEMGKSSDSSAKRREKVVRAMKKLDKELSDEKSDATDFSKEDISEAVDKTMTESSVEREISMDESDEKWTLDNLEAAERELERETRKSLSGGKMDEERPTNHDKEKYSHKDYDMSLSELDLTGYEKAYSEFMSVFGNSIRAFEKKLERLFKNDLDEKEHKKSGKINIKRYSSDRVTTRVFDKKTVAGKIDDLAVFILIDESGSMGVERSEVAKSIALSLTEAFGSLKIPVYSMGFSGEEKDDVEHYHYVKWRNTKRDRLSLFQICGRCQNFDSYSINCAAKILKKKKAAHHLLIVVSDGVPCCHYENGEAGIANVREEIRKIRKSGTDVLGIAVGNSDTETLHSMYGKYFFHACSLKTAFIGVSKEVSKIIQNW